MERYRRKKLFIIMTLILAISGLTIGFAAFSQVLSISSSATVTPDAGSFSVKFSKQQNTLDESAVVASSKSDGVEVTDGVIDNSTASPSISNLSASFTKPGQYAEYTFYARNEGGYKAYLNNVNFIGPKVCGGGADASDALVQAACESINITITVGSSTYNQTTTIMNHPLEKGAGEKVVVRINYASDGALADGEFNVSFGRITLVYSSVDDSTFSAPIISTNNQNTINYKMQSVAVSDSGINFDVEPETGVYFIEETRNDTNPIYYYRGAVENNNVKFANFCWKAVRTTETGGVKLIYNGVPAADGSCNNTGTSSQLATKSAFNTNYSTTSDVRYIYENGTDSTIKGVVDAWYAENMIPYTSSLEDIGWCSDLSVYKTENNVTYYGAYGRNAETYEPSVNCPAEYEMKVSSTTAGNKLKYPVALLTADEATLAGSGWDGYSADAYLNTGQVWWALSPVVFDSGGYANVAYVYSVGYGGHISVYYSIGVRPAVSLAPGTEITGSGDGTASNPFVVR